MEVKVINNICTPVIWYDLNITQIMLMRLMLHIIMLMYMCINHRSLITCSFSFRSGIPPSPPSFIGHDAKTALMLETKKTCNLECELEQIVYYCGRQRSYKKSALTMPNAQQPATSNEIEAASTEHRAKIKEEDEDGGGEGMK